MPQWINLARWLHILASAAWFGEIAMMGLCVGSACVKAYAIRTK